LGAFLGKKRNKGMLSINKKQEGDVVELQKISKDWDSKH
jgi:hypothetical protein